LWVKKGHRLDNVTTSPTSTLQVNLDKGGKRLEMWGRRKQKKAERREERFGSDVRREQRIEAQNSYPRENRGLAKEEVKRKLKIKEKKKSAWRTGEELRSLDLGDHHSLP